MCTAPSWYREIHRDTDIYTERHTNRRRETVRNSLERIDILRAGMLI